MSQYTALPPALKRVQYDPAVDGSVTATAFFETTIQSDTDANDKVVKPWVPVTFTLPPAIAAEISDLALDALTP
jgi:hypothetical protein